MGSLIFRLKQTYQKFGMWVLYRKIVKKLCLVLKEELTFRIFVAKHNAVYKRVFKNRNNRYLSAKFKPFGFHNLYLDNYKQSFTTETYQRILNREFKYFSHSWYSAKAINRFHLQTSDVPSTISWHRDPLTGYCFSEKTWSKRYRIEPDKGYDIKRIWEIARLHHLPILLNYGVVDMSKKEAVLTEFYNQVLDFHRSNPVGVGPHWISSMEVSIRLVNLIVATEIAMEIAYHGQLDEDFQELLNSSVMNHIHHISNNLEIYGERRNNHYLCNLAGLVIGYLSLETSDFVNEQTIESVHQFINEINIQFYDDGGNFESSMGYHKLSLQVVLYTLLACKQANWKLIASKKTGDSRINKFISKDQIFQLPLNTLKKVYNAIIFLEKCSVRTGDILNFGDNDSGCLLMKVEDFVDQHEGSNINSLKSLIQNFRKAFNEDFDKLYVKSNSQNNSLVRSSRNSKNTGDMFLIGELNIDVCNVGECEPIIFHDSGVALIRGKNFLVSLINTPVGQNGYGGHKHDDYLSVELFHEKWILRDPGTFTYTEDTQNRNQLRDKYVHNGPFISASKSVSFPSLFATSSLVKTDLWNSGLTIIGEITDGTHILNRKVELTETHLRITDSATTLTAYSPLNYILMNTPYHFYGKRYE